jgi:DNA-binding PadR family transcriptional regulator
MKHTSRSNLGELEEQVLLTLLRLEGSAAAGQVADELSSRTGREVSPATTFMVMRRLEQRGLLTSRVEDTVAASAGRPRRIYVAKPSVVLPLLRASRRARLALWDGLEGLLK